MVPIEFPIFVTCHRDTKSPYVWRTENVPPSLLFFHNQGQAAGMSGGILGLHGVALKVFRDVSGLREWVKGFSGAEQVLWNVDIAGRDFSKLYSDRLGWDRAVPFGQFLADLDEQEAGGSNES